ncbi:MAG: MFS transporter [Rhodospirillaceae bacterium]|nr:MFS transporter [Rhodospirillaceae bacterium]
MPHGEIGAPFHGWRVVGACFAVLTLTFGAAYAFPAFFDPLAKEFPGSRGNISLVFAVCGFLFFVVGAIAGPVADRIGSRRVVGTGVVLVGIGLVAASFGQSLWQVLAAYGLGVGLGVGMAYVPAVSPVQRWFLRQRGRASGFAVAGIGVGTFCGPLLATAIMQVSDWRIAWLAIGLGAGVLALIAAQFLIDSPAKVGQFPDGDAAPPPVAGQAPAGALGWSLRPALFTKPFLLFYAAAFACSVPLFLPFVHLVPFARDRGIAGGTAVLIASLIGIGSILGRFGLGSIADRLGRRVTLAAMFLGLTIMFGVWAVSSAAWQLAAFAVIFGACYGGFVALMPAVIIDYLGPRNAGAIIGALYTSVAPGTLIGPPLAGYAYDLWGSYTAPLLVSVGFMALAALIAFVAPDPAKWRAANPAR